MGLCLNAWCCQPPHCGVLFLLSPMLASLRVARPTRCRAPKCCLICGCNRGCAAPQAGAATAPCRPSRQAGTGRSSSALPLSSECWPGLSWRRAVMCLDAGAHRNRPCHGGRFCSSNPLWLHFQTWQARHACMVCAQLGCASLCSAIFTPASTAHCNSYMHALTTQQHHCFQQLEGPSLSLCTQPKAALTLPPCTAPQDGRGGAGRPGGGQRASKRAAALLHPAPACL